jgi:hypothetical protein
VGLALDGHILGNNTGGTSVSASLSTSTSNDVIIASIVSNSTVSSISASGLTFNEVSGMPYFGTSTNNIDFYWAPASSPLSSVSITADMSASTYVTMIAFGISGANISSPFDAAAVGASASTVTISTTAANTFIFATAVDNGATPSGTFTEIETQTTFNFTEYAIFSSPQTNLVVGTAPSGHAIAAVAVKAASGGGAQGIKRNSSLSGLGASGPFFHDPLAGKRSLGWRPSLVAVKRKLILPRHIEKIAA